MDVSHPLTPWAPHPQARNVMLKSSGTEGRGVTAKIADFGLAVRIDTTQQTHMSNLFQVSHQRVKCSQQLLVLILHSILSLDHTLPGVCLVRSSLT